MDLLLDLALGALFSSQLVLSNFNNLQDAGGTRKPCKEREGVLIRQLTDSRVVEFSNRCRPMLALPFLALTAQRSETKPAVCR
jgi:hypothetical protein